MFISIVAAILVYNSKRLPIESHALQNQSYFDVKTLSSLLKVLLITFKIINSYAPSYLSNLPESYKPKHALRSATKRLLIVPKAWFPCDRSDRPSRFQKFRDDWDD